MSKKRYALRIPNKANGIRLQCSLPVREQGWWARRWLGIVESMCVGARLGKGRNYAVSGQITHFQVDATKVIASVMGARPKPYDVAISFRRPEGDARKKIIKSLKSEVITVARLLAGDLPLEVEEAFRAHGFSFFPGGKISPGCYDMTLSCSCPDYANPCKHIAAVLYVLGEEISRRPLTLMELRGISVEDLL